MEKLLGKEEIEILIAAIILSVLLITAVMVVLCRANGGQLSRFNEIINKDTEETCE